MSEIKVRMDHSAGVSSAGASSAGVSDTWAFSLAYSSIFRAIISRHGPSSLSKAFTSRTENFRVKVLNV